MTTKRRLRPRICPECSQSYEPKSTEARFCSRPCKDAWHNRAMKRGKVAMPLVLAWRASRNRRGDRTGAYAFAELCALADRWNAEDRDAGRQPAIDYIKPKQRAGWKAADLQIAPPS